ncbi:hypothetical protein [Streptosporangium vulgare]|uniref:hypothetical protein n=1 Tax=Streptosporangium vulgare TaxID=46190 RepID=UPI0031CE0EFD
MTDPHWRPEGTRGMRTDGSPAHRGQLGDRCPPPLRETTTSSWRLNTSRQLSAPYVRHRAVARVAQPP